MITQEQILKREKKCDKKGHHEWANRGKDMLRRVVLKCQNCGKQLTQDDDGTQNITSMKV